MSRKSAGFKVEDQLATQASIAWLIFWAITIFVFVATAFPVIGFIWLIATVAYCAIGPWVGAF